MKLIKIASILLSIFILGIISYVLVDGLQKNITLEAGTLYPEDYRRVSTFELIDNKNKSFNQDNFNDKWTLLFFGFTHCPDVCPASLVTLQQIEQKIKSHIPAEQMEYVFVSVDPKRDNTKQLDAYVSYFSPNFTAITGQDKELKKLSSSLAAFYAIPQNSKDEHYLVEHSASIYLIGKNARPKVLFSYPHSAEKIANDIIKLYKS